MSAQPINPDASLQRLLDAGYHIRFTRENALIVENVPFLKTDGTIGRGLLYDTVSIGANFTVGPPRDHTMVFVGPLPCGSNGHPNSDLKNGDRIITIDGQSIAGIYMSRKPQGTGRYNDWEDKILTYLKLIEGPARQVDAAASASSRTFVPATNPYQDVFMYPNNAPSRSGTDHLNSLFEGKRVAIVGLGGTGGFVLDHLAKLPCELIRLIDDDIFEAHTAFRAPGAASRNDIALGQLKVNYYHSIYSQMHRGIDAHGCRLEEGTFSLIDDVDFVFLCIDVNSSKPVIVSTLMSRGVPFIDTGIGAELQDSGIHGVIRSTLIEPDDPANALKSVVLQQSPDNAYDLNIQVSDLNAINAAIAVIQYKVYSGFYTERPGMKANLVFPIGRNQPIGMGASAEEGIDDASAA